MKNNIGIALIVLLVTLFFNGCSYQNKKPFRVWVIHSYQKECSWMDDMNKGIRDGFERERVNVELTFSYLHSNYNTKRCRDSVKAILDRMDPAPDIILSVNDQATAALMAITHPVIDENYGCKVIFCGIDYPGRFTPGNGKNNFMGYTCRIDFERNRELANLFGLRKMNLYLRHTNICSTATQEILKQSKIANSPVEIRLDTLDNKIYHDVFYLMTGEKFQYFNVLPEWDCYLAEFIKTSSTPYIALGNEGFGEGYLGGYFTSSYQQTYDGARLAALQLLRKSYSVKFMQESPKQLFIDWKVLKHFNFSTEMLPRDTRFIHMPFYIRYRIELMIAAIAGAVLLTLFIVFFIHKINVYKHKKKKAEERLKQQRDNLQVITDSISEGIISIDSDGKIVSMNAEAKELLRLNQADIRYTGIPLDSLIEIVDVSASHTIQSFLQATLKEKQTIRLSPSAMIQCKHTNKYFLAEGEFKPLETDKSPNGAVFSFTDRTDEFTTQEYLSLTAANGLLFFWWYDFRREKFIVDPSFFTQFDIPDDGSHTLPLSVLLQSINPEDLATWQDIYAHQRFNKDFKTIQEARININGKGEQWWEIRIAYHHSDNTDSDPTLYGMCINIQNYKEKQAILQETRENVNRSEQLKSAFLSNMSHEIRTPLNGIIGFARLIASDETFAPDEHKLFVETIQSNCNLMLALINDILDLARIDSGNMIYQDTLCNLNELIQQILTTQQVILQKSLTFIQQLPDEPEYLHIDQIRLNQVITNLVNNAVKFTNEGSVTVGYTADATQIRIFVSDTGIGIPKGEQTQIFERFYKKNNEIQGAGIGLNLCKNIIEHYNGQIQVDSEVGKGTTFTVTLLKRKVNNSNS